MATNLVGYRDNSREICDGPAIRSSDGEVDHAADNGQDESIHPLEVANDTIKADAESRGFEFLGCGRPFHVDAEGVAQQGLEEMEREATEEENEHRSPLDSFPETDKEGFLAESVS